MAQAGMFSSVAPPMIFCTPPGTTFSTRVRDALSEGNSFGVLALRKWNSPYKNPPPSCESRWRLCRKARNGCPASQIPASSYRKKKPRTISKQPLAYQLQELCRVRRQGVLPLSGDSLSPATLSDDLACTRVPMCLSDAASVAAVVSAVGYRRRRELLIPSSLVGFLSNRLSPRPPPPTKTVVLSLVWVIIVSFQPSQVVLVSGLIAQGKHFSRLRSLRIRDSLAGSKRDSR